MGICRKSEVKLTERGSSKLDNVYKNDRNTKYQAGRSIISADANL